MSQQFWTPWSLQENCGEGDDFIPFVTRSRTVSRCRSPSASVWWCSSPMGAWSDGTEVEDLTQHGSAGWMEVYEEASPWLLSGQAVERMKPTSPSGLGLDRLPSPRELYGRRKGQNRRQRRPRVHSSSTAVLAHLEELKKRQNCINQLKGPKWGSSRSQGSALDTDESLIDQEWQPVECSSNTTETYSSNTEAQEPLFRPRWSFGVQEQCPVFPHTSDPEKSAGEKLGLRESGTDPTRGGCVLWGVGHLAEE
ncbi:protein INCA1-like [Mobula hypostoma]|uniref:protein INCA1-like n=1 Tax=Mobula hypostoma TaxID=723540 RepID=UPI002FC3CEED